MWQLCLDAVDSIKGAEVLDTARLRVTPLIGLSVGFLFFSRVHATLQVTMSVCRSVGRSVPLYFFCIY